MRFVREVLIYDIGPAWE